MNEFGGGFLHQWIPPHVPDYPWYHHGTGTGNSIHLGDECQYCPGTIHVGGPCPNVKAIEYHRDGTVRRVEFRELTVSI